MNIGPYIAIMELLAKLIPVIKRLVQSLDDVNDAPGTGPEKLEFVLALVKQAFVDFKATGLKWEEFEPYVKAAAELLLKLIRR